MLILSDVCDPSHITADFLQHGISVLQKKKKKEKKRITLLVKSLKIINWNNFLEPKASSTTIVQIADKLLRNYWLKYQG